MSPVKKVIVQGVCTSFLFCRYKLYLGVHYTFSEYKQKSSIDMKN